ncbi:hypothetical protein IAT40_000271 [Kwoniella sp. CBS 6097]
MGRHRLEDVSCAICMDSLFTKRDDLDDLVPIATCDCGHVLHEPCLLEWFRTQSDQYLAQAREHGIEGRHGSPSLSDAPAECPTCRAECYADPETGQPSIHRLYIDWGGVLDNAPSHTQAGSSPVRSMHASGSGSLMRNSIKDREILGLARRAKGVTEEAKGLGADSQDEEMDGMLKRASDLEKDFVSIKALEAVKTYIGGLSSSLEKLDRTLRSHPLIPGLKARHDALEQQIKDINRETRNTLSREIKKARDEERTRSNRKVEEAENVRDLMQVEMNKERTARKRAIEAYEAREKDLNNKLEQAVDEARKEKEERESLKSLLQERMKQLKVLQSTSDSRKTLKKQIEELRAENDRLKAEIIHASFAPDSQAEPSNARARARDRSFTSQNISYDEAEEEEEPGPLFDRSQSPLNASPSASTSSHRYPTSSADDSLQIDMPSFLDPDDSSRSIPKFLPAVTTSKDLKHYGTRTSPTKRATGRHKMHPTARTIVFDLEEDERRKEESRKKRKTESKYFGKDSQDRGDRTLQEVQHDNMSTSVGDLYYKHDGLPRGASETAKRRENSSTPPPELHFDEENGTYEIIPESQPEGDHEHGPGYGPEPEPEVETEFGPSSKRSKTNPFATTRQASEKRKQLPYYPSTRAVHDQLQQPDYLTNEIYDVDQWKGEVIDLASSSPPSSPKFRSSAGTSRSRSTLGPAPAPAPSRRTHEPTSAQAQISRLSGNNGIEGRNHNRGIGGSGDGTGTGTGTRRQPSVVDFLGIRDSNGRPKKGIVSGHQKLKRRA